MQGQCEGDQSYLQGADCLKLVMLGHDADHVHVITPTKYGEAQHCKDGRLAWLDSQPVE